MIVKAVLTQVDESWIASCEEIDRAGEGSTPEAALESLREALEEVLHEPGAVAPPTDVAVHEPIEIIVAGGKTDPTR